MKRKWKVIIFIIFALFSLVSCGNESNTTEIPTTSSDGIEPVKCIYSINNDEVSIIGYSNVSSGDTEIVIPNTIEGYPVTRISNEAFKGSRFLISIILPDSLVGIGNEAFADCVRLESIYIPSSTTEIGGMVFSGCAALSTIKVDENNNVFDSRNDCNAIIETATNTLKYGCKNTIIPSGVIAIERYSFSKCVNLTTLFIPDTIKTIGDYAFSNCSSLTSIEIPDSVTYVGEGAFWFCSSLASVTLSNNIENIERVTFVQCASLTSITIPNGVRNIKEEAFNGCVQLNTIVIPASLESIETNAFIYCNQRKDVYVNGQFKDWLEISLFDNDSSPMYRGGNIYVLDDNGSIELDGKKYSSLKNMTKLEIPSDITSISNHAFVGFSKLTSITIPNSVTSIGNSAFFGCKSLVNITIPESVTSIGASAFTGCSSLKRITIPFIGASINGDKNTNFYHIFGGLFSMPESLTDVRISGGSEIPKEAFIGCNNLTSITIPHTVTSIGERAFMGCGSLTSISIPNSVTTIGQEAFSGCANLTSIKIPTSVTYIGRKAFAYATNLEAIYYVGTPENFSYMYIGPDNDSFQNALVYYYSKTEPLTEGNYWHYDSSGKIVHW